MIERAWYSKKGQTSVILTYAEIRLLLWATETVEKPITIGQVAHLQKARQKLSEADATGV